MDNNLYNNNFDFNKYRFFLAVAKYESFSKAADNLHISQPAISYAIKELESDLNTTLFIREKKRVTLTENGKIFKKYVEESMNILIKGTKVLKENESLNGTIKIGIYSHIGTLFLPKIVKEYIELHPNVVFDTLSASGDILRDKLRSSEIDLLISHYPKTNDYFNYKEKKLFSLETCFFGTKEYYDAVTSGDKSLQELPMVLPSKGFITSYNLEKVFREKGITLKSNIYSYTSEILVAYAKAGIGVAWGLKKFVEKELENKELYEIPIDIELPVMDFGIVYNEKYLNEPTKDFIEFLIEKSSTI